MNGNRSRASILTCLLAQACGGAPSQAPPAMAATAESQQSEPSAPTLAAVDASILFTDCANVSGYSAKLAEKTMRRLVEGCSNVPGGQAQFIATLQPGGRIEIAEVKGADATVPICVLKHQLSHQVQIRRACQMHVQMEQKTPAPITDAGATGKAASP